MNEFFVWNSAAASKWYIMHSVVFVVVLCQPWKQNVAPFLQQRTKNGFVRGISIIYWKMGNSRVKTEIKIRIYVLSNWDLCMMINEQVNAPFWLSYFKIFIRPIRNDRWSILIYFVYKLYVLISMAQKKTNYHANNNSNNHLHLLNDFKFEMNMLLVGNLYSFV